MQIALELHVLVTEVLSDSRFKFWCLDKFTSNISNGLFFKVVVCDCLKWKDSFTNCSQSKANAFVNLATLSFCSIDNFSASAH